MANKKAGACAKCPGGQCLVGPYEEIVKECRRKGGQAHHVPPDWSIRQGNRPKTAKEMGSVAGRIFGSRNDGSGKKKKMPSLNKGPSICLKGHGKTKKKSQHKTAHKSDAWIEKETNKKSNLPKGTITLKKVLFLSKKAASEAAPECKQDIKDAVDDAYKDYDKNTLVRGLENPRTKPRFTPEALKAWKTGQAG